jgi:hypothetical protein
MTNEERFENADWYDARNQDHLQHDSYQEEIEALVDSHCEPGCDVREVIAKLGEVTVRAFDKQGVTDKWIEDEAATLVEYAMEHFDEVYGGEDPSELSTEEQAHFQSRMQAVVGDIVAKLTVYPCDEVASRTFSPEEIETMMRTHRPDWFEAEQAVSP